MNKYFILNNPLWRFLKGLMLLVDWGYWGNHSLLPTFCRFSNLEGHLSKIPCLVKMSCRFCAKYITVHSTCNTRMWSEIVPSRWYWRTYNNIVALLDVTRDWKDPASVRPSAVMLVPTMKAPERVTT